MSLDFFPVGDNFDSKNTDRIVIIGCTDIHLANKNPGSWIYPTSYKEFMFQCVDQIFHFAKSENADALVVAGDVFHTRRPDQNPPAFVNECIRVFKQFVNNDIPVFGIAGNHDLGPEGFDGLKDQPLGTLELAGVYRLLDNNPVQFSSITGGLSLFVSGFSWGYDTETFINIEAEKDVTSPASYHLRLGHFLFGLHSGDFHGESVIGPDCLGSGNYDIVFTGHRHEDQGIKKIGGKYYVNPGAVTRSGRYAHDRFRRPACVRMVFSRMDDPNIRIARLKVPTAEELFDFETLDEQNEDRHELEKFVESMRSQVLMSNVESPQTILEGMNIPDEVHSKALEYLEKAEAA